MRDKQGNMMDEYRYQLQNDILCILVHGIYQSINESVWLNLEVVGHILLQGGGSQTPELKKK